MVLPLYTVRLRTRNSKGHQPASTNLGTDDATVRLHLNIIAQCLIKFLFSTLPNSHMESLWAGAGPRLELELDCNTDCNTETVGKAML